MHRHRRCVQIHQEYGFEHGYETPREVLEAGHDEAYTAVMQRAADAGRKLAPDSTSPVV